MNSEDEIELIRQKKLQELLAKQQNSAIEEEQMKQRDAVKQNLMRQILTPQARERLANLRIARPELVESVEKQLIMLAQSGRINQQIDDKTLKDLLRRIAPKKREIKIERR
ncbi:MAG TPA: DNA-binding protein [Euryarchaeota archaeon]|nr:DNA-binding protein [Euryarchaeota archaeon]